MSIQGTDIPMDGISAEFSGRKPELLAPAGSIEALKAAAAAGADAVYIGGSSFGARAYAQNPDTDALLEAVDYLHLRGKKLYLTVNTLVKDQEIEEKLAAFMEPLYEQGIDGVIVQDFGVFSLFRRLFPKLPLHASTQMAVTGAYGASLLQKLGAQRVVPARELSLKEIREIYNRTHMEIECFVHGAMCYSYSGVCLMSSLIGGRSGNRGRCAGVCRLPFRVSESRRGLHYSKPLYPLNMKDLCALDLLPDMLAAGIVSFKIEGRMKRPEYTAGVTSVYRKYMDRAVRDPGNYQVSPEDRKELMDLFNRDGFSDGFYRRHNGKTMIAPENRKNEDPIAGRSKNADSRYKQIREFLNRTELQTPVRGFLHLAPGEPSVLTLRAPGTEISAAGDAPEPALKIPMNRQDVSKQIRKTGGSAFCFSELEIDLPEKPGIFIPNRSLNELRRKAFAALEEEILRPFRRKTVPWEPEEKRIFKKPESGYRFWILTRTLSALERILDDPGMNDFGLILPIRDLEEAFSNPAIRAHRIRVYLPYVTRSVRQSGIPELCRKAVSDYPVEAILVRNLESAAFLLEEGLQDYLMLDHSVYTMNHEAVRFFRELGISRFTVPLELNRREIENGDFGCGEMVVYGRAPMMVSASCVRKTTGKCRHKENTLLLKDRKNMVFPVCAYCRDCYNVIYNSLPTSLHAEKSFLRNAPVRSFRIELSVENAEEAQEAAARFLPGSGSVPAQGSFTEGHFKRGVE